MVGGLLAVTFVWARLLSREGPAAHNERRLLFQAGQSLHCIPIASPMRQRPMTAASVDQAATQILRCGLAPPDAAGPARSRRVGWS